MSIHIEAKPGDIADKILLPGDPLRAKFIAENFLEDAVCFNNLQRTPRQRYGNRYGNAIYLYLCQRIDYVIRC